MREADYVSFACAMVPRKLWVRFKMFDQRYSPGYYEDSDLAFTFRRHGFRILYQPFATAVHEAHTTYAKLGSMEHLLARNRQSFMTKWKKELRGKLPPCTIIDACDQSSNDFTLFMQLAATATCA